MTKNNDTMSVLRRRITDKMCKDQDFLHSVTGLAIEEGAIKYTDVLDVKQVTVLLGAPGKA